jgi:hypothetical protein
VLSLVFRIAVAVAIFAVVLRVGLWAIRMIATPAPPPLPKGELRRINVKYRCSMCGMEMRVMLAPDEDPEPPRHCMEDMDLLPARE